MNGVGDRCWRERNLDPPAGISLTQAHASQTVAAGGIAEICNGLAQRRHLGQFLVGTNNPAGSEAIKLMMISSSGVIHSIRRRNYVELTETALVRSPVLMRQPVA